MEHHIRLDMDQETLVARIRRLGQSGVSTRQIAERVRILFPDRFREIVQRNGRDMDAAYLSSEYHNLVTEYVNIMHQNLELKILYEIHWMLLNSRSTLRSLRRRRST